MERKNAGSRNAIPHCLSRTSRHLNLDVIDRRFVHLLSDTDTAHGAWHCLNSTLALSKICLDRSSML